MPNETPMPKYRCHKEVWALKIKKVMLSSNSVTCWLTFEEPGSASIPVSSSWIARHDVRDGGYYVVYEDGYSSYSPAKAFEDGYTRI